MAEPLAGSQGTKPGPVLRLGRKGPGVEKNTAGSVQGTLGQPSTMALPGSRLDPSSAPSPQARQRLVPGGCGTDPLGLPQASHFCEAP